jgi:beta-lactam-binding protein with PASTA domain
VAESRDEVFSVDVPAGSVAETAPAMGEPVPRDTVVQLFVSKGPEPRNISEFAGLPEQTAVDNATNAGFRPTDSERQFDGEVAEGTVLAAYGVDENDERIQLEPGQSYFDQKPVTFLVSAGPLPQVTGLPVDDAIALLSAKNIAAKEQAERVFNNDIADGAVISMAPVTPNTSLAPGDAGVTLVVSKGPDLVDVPAVVGMSVGEARTALEAAEFTVRVISSLPSDFQNDERVEVRSVRPAEARVLRGSEITIVLNY